MKLLRKITLAAALGVLAATAALAAEPAAIQKNWTAPMHKMLAQALVDDVMASHPELLSLTLQGEPPGHKGVYTMFAGSFPDRIGKVSSAVDVLVITKGYTILDPRWNQDDNPRKSTYLTPLRDKAGQNVGLAVVVFKNPAGTNKSEKEFFLAASEIRDKLAQRIPSHAALFGPAAQP
ncbi:hypothetical protein LJR290_006836 [Variovorax sp. LjRoot290]|uniref:hypothetical protein n=1 Tax=Variovorax sp. LjRoot290 TaxID=3342316 RepID=UPI003ECF5E4F